MALRPTLWLAQDGNVKEISISRRKLLSSLMLVRMNLSKKICKSGLEERHSPNLTPRGIYRIGENRSLIVALYLYMHAVAMVLPATTFPYPKLTRMFLNIKKKYARKKIQ